MWSYSHILKKLTKKKAQFGWKQKRNWILNEPKVVWEENLRGHCKPWLKF